MANAGNSPIVYVEFPHFLADGFSPPAGWTAKSTLLVNINVKKAPGVCTATADEERFGIPPGGSAEFKMRMSVDGQRGQARKGAGVARVRFADGAIMEVAGVSVPVQPPQRENVVLISGFGVILLLFVLAARRKKKRRTPEACVASD